LARLRDNYAQFVARGAEILAIGPDQPKDFSDYWARQQIPFKGLPDPGHEVARRYKQQINIFKWGRMPLVTVVDGQGQLRYAHYGQSMSDIPDNSILLAVIDELNSASN